MTPQEINNLSSRDLDIACAKAMGWPCRKPGYLQWGKRPYIADFPDGPHAYPVGKDTWFPSTDIADAWTLVEQAREWGESLSLDGDNTGYRCWFSQHPYGQAPTAPLAICRAFLHAIAARTEASKCD